MNEQEIAKEYLERALNAITDKSVEAFKKLGALLEDDSYKVDVDGYYFTQSAVNAVETANKGFHMNQYMDLTVSNILNMVKENDTVEQAVRHLFDDFKYLSAFSWALNFINVLEKIDFDAAEYNDPDLEESKHLKEKESKELDNKDVQEERLLGPSDKVIAKSKEKGLYTESTGTDLAVEAIMHYSKDGNGKEFDANYLNEDIQLYLLNDQRLYNGVHNTRRPAHSVAYDGLIYALNSVCDFKLSSSQIKAGFKKLGLDFKEVIKPSVEYVEEKRKEDLEESKKITEDATHFNSGLKTNLLTVAATLENVYKTMVEKYNNNSLNLTREQRVILKSASDRIITSIKPLIIDIIKDLNTYFNGGLEEGKGVKTLNEERYYYGEIERIKDMIKNSVMKDLLNISNYIKENITSDNPAVQDYTDKQINTIDTLNNNLEAEYNNFKETVDNLSTVFPTKIRLITPEEKEYIEKHKDEIPTEESKKVTESLDSDASNLINDMLDRAAKELDVEQMGEFLQSIVDQIKSYGDDLDLYIEGKKLNEATNNTESSSQHYIGAESNSKEITENDYDNLINATSYESLISLVNKIVPEGSKDNDKLLDLIQNNENKGVDLVDCGSQIRNYLEKNKLIKLKFENKVTKIESSNIDTVKSALQELNVSSFEELDEEIDRLLDEEIIDDDQYDDFKEMIDDASDDFVLYITRRAQATNTDYEDELAIEDNYVQSTIQEMIKSLTNLNEHKKIKVESKDITIPGLTSYENLADTFHNYKAFAANFKPVIIVKINKQYYIYKTTAENSQDYIYNTDSKENIDGWLYGAVQCKNKRFENKQKAGNKVEESKEVKTESEDIIVNPEDKDYYEDLYKVMLYPGAGAEYCVYKAYANYEEQALEIVVAYCEKEAPGLLYNQEDVDPDDNVLYVDATEYGAIKPYYVSSLLKIETVDELNESKLVEDEEDTVFTDDVEDASDEVTDLDYDDDKTAVDLIQDRIGQQISVGEFNTLLQSIFTMYNRVFLLSSDLYNLNPEENQEVVVDVDSDLYIINYDIIDIDNAIIEITDVNVE